MRETLVLFRRDLRSYFLSPIAYVFGILFLGLSIFFATNSMLVHGQQASMEYYFQLLPLVFLFFLPALTMRLWAEERKLGTLELLMTFPVRISQLIAGKFLAVMAYLAVLLALTLALPITLSIYGRLDWGPVVGAYLATFLMAGAYVSVGMFWSSTTRDQIIALLLAMVTLVLLYFLGNPFFLELVGDFLRPLPESLRVLIVDLLGGISPFRYFLSVSRGVLDTRDMIYYICFCGFFLYSNALVLRGLRHRG
ncbi:MAG: ABC transporter permease subunit [Planctomycetota bacterium]